ncbi:CrcB family protein [Lactiplantibacillus plajomi]|uniref:Fluoride-specific ion channel FluC n=1 Tax=Lactiplantibacillus plajomi TaxID=1457217 RepID=A0ABV6KA67_9LACO|nr:CrcB family protein [Lactiplantibacillus plajomi]
MKKLLAIAFFAMLGGGFREALNLLITWPQQFWLTVLINVVGAFLLSIVTGILPVWLPLSETVVTGMSVGLIGSFTTFSTFTTETLRLVQTSHSVLALSYLTVSIGLGLVAGLGGTLLTETWLKQREV